MQAFFNSRFSYCPLVWMFHSRQINTKINNLHYRALRMVYMDENSSFEELLQKGGSVTIHHRNLQTLATEMFKVSNGMAPSFMKEVFGQNDNALAGNVSSNTRSQRLFYNNSNPNTVNNGLETLRHLGPKIWAMLSKDLQNAPSHTIFKTRIKRWVPHNCPCRLCKLYVPQLGYL